MINPADIPDLPAYFRLKNYLKAANYWEQQRTELLAEQAHHTNELLSFRLAVEEHLLMRDALGKFGGEDEAFRGAGEPVLDHLP